MCFLRGDALDELRLTAYTDALIEEFKDTEDIYPVLTRLAKAEIGQHEKRIPELGKLLAQVRDQRRDRLDKKAQQDWNAHLADAKAHPEKYITLAEILREYREQKAS